jgi:hypothetical protein
MSQLKHFTFYVQNDTTREVATFKGQGVDLESAWKDAITGITSKFNGDSSGGGWVLPLNVRLPGGRHVSRMKDEFEGEEIYKEPRK